MRRCPTDGNIHYALMTRLSQNPPDLGSFRFSGVILQSAGSNRSGTESRVRLVRIFDFFRYQADAHETQALARRDRTFGVARRTKEAQE